MENFATEHAQERATERLTLELTPELAEKIVSDICLGKAILQEQHKNSREYWIVQAGERLANVVFDRVRLQILTIWSIPEREARLYHDLLKEI